MVLEVLVKPILFSGVVANVPRSGQTAFGRFTFGQANLKTRFLLGIIFSGGEEA